MYKNLLEHLSEKPSLYAPSTSKFWDDEHISKSMLEAHLNPELEAATRKLDFVRHSAGWIADLADPTARPRLLDLGCGPGIYAELFDQLGFQVTGMDLSPRSIRYANENALKKKLKINYLLQNYLELDEEAAFDVITLIYCDFGVLCPEDRNSLLRKIHRALKPGGLFIVDAWTPSFYTEFKENKEWSYAEGGFWSDQPYACLKSFYRYEECNTFADQYVIVREDGIDCYNIWNHAYTPKEFRADLGMADFHQVSFYGNVAGDLYTEDSTSICAVAGKLA
jgi:SAM-dependent methyltransferase